MLRGLICVELRGEFSFAKEEEGVLVMFAGVHLSLSLYNCTGASIDCGSVWNHPALTVGVVYATSCNKLWVDSIRD